ncbi:MAG: hypothetical protein NZ534_01540, partial [Bacteroidia bacterium]|nr:hypothetical protein [Bacteroidia bacterium]
MRTTGWVLAAVLAAACRRDACEGVNCEVGRYCENGNCVCAAGTISAVVVAGGAADQTVVGLSADARMGVRLFAQGTGKVRLGADSLDLGAERTVYWAHVSGDDSISQLRPLASAARLGFGGAFSAVNGTLVYGSWSQTGLFDGRTLSALDGTDGLLARFDATGALEKTMLFGGRANQSFTAAFE